MAVEGSLDLFSLPEILQLISQQGKTGILTIQGQQDIVAISFLGGRIVAADSLAHTVEERLGKVLVSENLLSAPELARAHAENQAAGGRLLDLLVERGYLSRQQLLSALRLQTIRHLEDLLHWREGDFKFYGGDEVSYEDGFEPISVEDLLLRHLDDFAGPAVAPHAAAGQRPHAAPPPPVIPISSPRRAPATPALRAASPTAPAVPAPLPAQAPPQSQMPPPPPPTPAASGETAAADAHVVPGPGASGVAAARARQAADGARADGGELWMPQLPDLPGGPVSPAPWSEASLAAAPAEMLESSSPLSLPSLPALPSSPPSPLPAASLQEQLMGPAAAFPASTAAPPSAAAAEGWAPSAAAGAATAAAAAVPPSVPAAGSTGAASSPPPAAAVEPLPWPAAVMSPPPASPPARPRPSGVRVVKRTGSQPPGTAAEGSFAPGPSAPGSFTPGSFSAGSSAAVSPPVAGGPAGAPPAAPLIPPDSAAAAARARSAGTSTVGAAPVFARTAAAAAKRGTQLSPAAAPAFGGAASPSLPKHFRQMQVERPEREVSVLQRLAVAGLAAAVAVSLAVAVWRTPQSALLPFPWQQEERAAFVRNQRESLFDKIDGAAKTAFLRDGRFPDLLAQLRDSGLLSPADLYDPRGEPLRYSAREDSYTLQATEAGKPLPDGDTSGSIAGNFFLDPSLLQSSAASGPPIVLLD
jgi:hypothetical protein